MKKYIFILLTLLFAPSFANAETITYEICKTGCEYSEFLTVGQKIDQMDDLSYKDIIINVTDSETYEWPGPIAFFGTSDNRIKSLSINLGQSNIMSANAMIHVDFFADKISLMNINYIGNIEEVFDFNSAKSVTINNSKIDTIGFLYNDNEEVLINDILRIDEQSLNDAKVLALSGNIKLENMDFSKNIISIMGGKIQIYNSNIYKLINSLENNMAETSIYNSKFYNFVYKRLSSDIENYDDDFDVWRNINDRTSISNIINFDRYILDIYLPEYNYYSNTMIYFDKEAEVKVNNKLNLVDYLDYYTEDKEISYTIEDETIAKIENKELIGLKPGNTKVQVTTDDGHVVYNIDLTVYKIEEKNISMKAETKLKLNSVFKDLDISSINDDVWEISNPKVAKIVNGEIISLQKGETDIVATINGVKYIYHLTVSDTLVSKEIKVPITGKNIKLWIVIVGILLLSVIGTCTYILIKKK